MTDRSTPTAGPVCPQDGLTPAPGPGVRFEAASGPQAGAEDVRAVLAWLSAERARSVRAAAKSRIHECRYVHDGMAAGLHLAQLRLAGALDGPVAAVRALAEDAERTAAAHTCRLCDGVNPLACPGSPHSSGRCWCGLGTRAQCATEPWGCGRDGAHAAPPKYTMAAPDTDGRAVLAAVLRAAMAAHRGLPSGDVWECLADAVDAHAAGGGQWVDRAVHEGRVRCAEADARRAEDARDALMAHRDQLAGALLRVLAAVEEPGDVRAAIRAAIGDTPLPRTERTIP